MNKLRRYKQKRKAKLRKIYKILKNSRKSLYERWQILNRIMPEKYSTYEEFHKRWVVNYIDIHNDRN